jgi:hypothetical protein
VIPGGSRHPPEIFFFLAVFTSLQIARAFVTIFLILLAVDERKIPTRTSRMRTASSFKKFPVSGFQETVVTPTGDYCKDLSLVDHMAAIAEFFSFTVLKKTMYP